MTDTIICPNCKTEIEISEALSSQLEDQMRKQLGAEQKRLAEKFEEKQEKLKEREAEIAKSEEAMEKEIESRLKNEKEKLLKEASDKAKEDIAVELKDKADELESTKTKLKEAQDQELELRKKSRELEEQKKEFDLTLSRTLDEERDKIREAAKKEAGDESLLKEAEKDKLIKDLTTQIGDLKRKSEQGSQQLQGEILELELEDLLKRTFPYDSIDEVPKGIRGADVLQNVYDSSGNHCGAILWESKRTKSWSDTWLPKLRDDQRAAKAEIAAIISVELPKGISTFSNIDGVWVTNWPCTIGLATALRSSLIEVAHAKQALDGQQGKMELLYNYLSGSEFRHRVEGIVEAFVTMKTDLDSEKRSMQRIWSKREKQLERAITQTAGLHGDLSGIIGNAIPAIEQLNLPALEGPEEEETITKE